MDAEPSNLSLNNSLTYEYKDLIILFLVVILVLSVLGINIFIILGYLIQYIVYLLQPLFSLFGYASGNIINTTSELAADVSHFGIDVADGTAHDVGNLFLASVDKQQIPSLPPAVKTYPGSILDAIGKTLSIHPTPQAKSEPTIVYVPTPAPAIHVPSPNTIYAQHPPSMKIPSADTADSPVQNPISTNKSQWCLAGEYQQRNGCVEVDNANKCMSGQLFPTQQMCLNPTLSTYTPPVPKKYDAGYYTQYGVLFPQVLYQQT